MTATLWWLVQNSIAVAVLVVVVGSTSRLARNRPAVQHALWLVILIKFLTPPIVSWPWSPSDIGNRLTVLVRPVEDEIASFPTGASRYGDNPRFTYRSSPADLPAVSNQTATRVEPTTTTEPTKTFALWLLFGLWLAGCAIAVAVQVRRIARHEAVVLRGRPAPQPLVDEIAGVAGKLGLRPVPALVVPHIATPFVWCLGWLRLIWPEALSANADVERWRGIIAHELAHVKRRDHWVAWLELIAGCLWWWNPLFWYVRRQLRETADLACDAQALSVVPGSDRRAYAETYLELSRLTSQRQTPAPALGVSTGARRTIERRLSMILNERVKAKTPVVGLLFAALLAVAALPAWSLGQDDSAAESTNTTETTDQPGERDAVARPRIRPGVRGELEIQTDRGRMSGKEVQVSGDEVVVSREGVVVEGPNNSQPRGANDDSRGTRAWPSLEELRRESIEGVEGGILDFTTTDSTDKQQQVQQIADALSMGRDSSTALVLNYRLGESQRAALLNLLIGLNAAQGDVKVSVVERDLRIVARPEVHLNLIRLISALQNGTRGGPDSRSGERAEESRNSRGAGESATEQPSDVEPRGPYPVDDLPPKVDGIVLASSSEGLVEISVGTDEGLRRGHQLVVYRVNSGDSKFLGKIEVVRAFADRAVAKVMPQYRKGPIQREDRVATRLN